MRKTPLAELRRSIVFGIGLFSTVAALSAAYAAYTAIVPVGTASSGSVLSSAEWNKVVSNLWTLDSQLSTAITDVAALQTQVTNLSASAWFSGPKFATFVRDGSFVVPPGVTSINVRLAGGGGWASANGQQWWELVGGSWNHSSCYIPTHPSGWSFMDSRWWKIRSCNSADNTTTYNAWDGGGGWFAYVSW